MTIQEFIAQYKNHPVLFIGTGISLRYLENSFTWDELLSKIALELTDNPEYYLDIKAKCYINEKFDYLKIADLLEQDFNKKLSEDRNGKFKEINDIFYKKMSEGVSLSRFKIYICNLFSELKYKSETSDELKELTYPFS
jgi:hypothetical protein